MQRLRLRHEHAEQLEQQAAQQAHQRALTLQRAVERGEPEPPPEASLLGTWQIIEHVFVVQGMAAGMTLGDKKLIFEQLAPDGYLTGRGASRDFSVLQAGGPCMYPKVVRYALEGKTPLPGHLRFLMTPVSGDAAVLSAGVMIMCPAFGSASWDGPTMSGEISQAGLQSSIEFRAVKVDD